MDDKPKGGWKALNGVSFDRKAALRRLKKVETASTRHAHRFLVSRLNNAKSVRREIGIWAVLMGIMIASMGLQFALSQQGYTKTAPLAGGTYAEAVLGPVGSLNPLYASTSAELSFQRLVFSSLYNYDNTGALHQDLATGMEVTENGAVYKVTLRKNARWHDGELVTAKDVAFTVNLIKNPATRATALRSSWEDVTVQVINDYTVEFKLPGASAAFPYSLTFPVLPVHILANVNAGALRENAYSAAPIGSGPFEYKLFQQADAITNHEVVHLVGNANYYGGKPKVEQMELYAYTSLDDIREALAANEVNGAADVKNVTDEDMGKTYTVVTMPLASGVYALFNNNNSILKDANVRRALQVGTDMAKVRSVVGGNVLPLNLPFTEGQLTGELPTPPTYNAASAAVMLDDAGWKLNGTERSKDGVALKLTITVPKNSQYQAAAQELASQWEALGVEAAVTAIDANNVATSFVQNVLQQRNFDVLVYELSIGADPDVYAYWHSSQGGTNISGYNFSNYANKNADAALASARTRLDPALRNAKYVAFAKQWVADVPALALYQPVMEYVVNKNNVAVIQGSKLVLPTDRYANVLYWSVERGPVYKTP